MKKFTLRPTFTSSGFMSTSLTGIEAFVPSTLTYVKMKGNCLRKGVATKVMANYIEYRKLRRNRFSV